MRVIQTDAAAGRGPAEVSVEAMASDALAVMDAEEIERFHLGHSLGGVIAQEIALRAPQRVQSLALMCTFARGRQGARITWAARGGCEGARSSSS